MLHKIGFIGLGTVGQHMAANLTKGDYELTVYDPNADKVAELVTMGATAAATAAEASRGKDLVIIIMTETDMLGPIFSVKAVYWQDSMRVPLWQIWGVPLWRPLCECLKRQPKSVAPFLMRRSGVAGSMLPTGF
jgi:hypothetical protein